MRLARLEPRHYAEVCKLFDINDPKLLVGANVMEYVQAVCLPTVDWPAVTGLSEGPVNDLRVARKFLGKVENNTLTDEDLAELRALKEPFYAKAFEAMRRQVREALAEAEGKAVIEPTPRRAACGALRRHHRAPTGARSSSWTSGTPGAGRAAWRSRPSNRPRRTS